MRLFSSFETRTVREHESLVAALTALAGVVDDPMFRTRLGKKFSYDQIELAMAYSSPTGDTAVLVA